LADLTKEQISKFKAKEKDAWGASDFQFLAEEVASTGDKVWAKKLYQKGVAAPTGVFESRGEEGLDSDNFVHLAQSAMDSIADIDFVKSIYKLAEHQLSEQKSIRLSLQISFINNLASSILGYLKDQEWSKAIYRKAENIAETADDFYSIADDMCRNRFCQHQVIIDKVYILELIKKAVEAPPQYDTLSIYIQIAQCLDSYDIDKDYCRSMFEKTIAFAKEKDRERMSEVLDLIQNSSFENKKEWMKILNNGSAKKKTAEAKK